MDQNSAKPEQIAQLGYSSEDWTRIWKDLEEAWRTCNGHFGIPFLYAPDSTFILLDDFQGEFVNTIPESMWLVRDRVRSISISTFYQRTDQNPASYLP